MSFAVTATPPAPVDLPAEPTAAWAVTCPTCDEPLPGLLATCPRPACLRADLTAEAALDARCER